MPYKNKEDKRKYRERTDVKDKKNKSRREKYANDPEYREKTLNALRQRNLLGYTKQWREENPQRCREYFKRWREKNKEKIKEYRIKYVKENKEKINAKRRELYKNNAEKIKEKGKLWRINNPEIEKERNRKYRKKNIDRIRKNKKLWNLNNPDKVREMNRNKCRRKRKTDIKYNLNKKISLSIRQTLKRGKNGKHWEDLVGYTLKDLIKRLKITMPKGYTWQDFHEGKLHIDHIIPKSVFNYTKPEHADFKCCWALSNLRLLPAKENIIKGAKLTKPFQPALKI